MEVDLDSSPLLRTGAKSGMFEVLVFSPAALSCRACAGGLGRVRAFRARSVQAGVLGLAASLCCVVLAPAARGQFPIRQVPERWTVPPAQNASAAGGAAPAPPSDQAAAPHPAIARITVPEKDGVSYGSGTLVDVRGQFGLVVTNWHVVRDAAGPISVEFPEGHKSQAEVIRTDKDWDLAALSVLRPKAEPLPVTDQAPQIGEWLAIAGYGGGQYRSATGFVRAYNSPSADLPQEFIELSAEARHGDSGGPILNQRGELCGVLFGSAPGYTCGAYGGRVRQFLATVVPGGIPGSDTAPALAAATSHGNAPLAPPPADNPADSAIVARADMGVPRNYVPPMGSQSPPRTTALHQPPPPYISGPIDNHAEAGLTPAQPPGDVPPNGQIDAKVALKDRLAANCGAADDSLASRPTRVHAPLPPRATGGAVAGPTVTDAPAGELLAATWQRFGGTTLYDQTKAVLAIFGALAMAVQLYKFTSRREADE